MQTDFDKNYLHKLSSKQTTFLVITGLLLWPVIGLAIANIYFFVTTLNFNQDIAAAIHKYNETSSDFFNYFRSNGNKISNECFTFDGKTIVITAPMILSSNAKQKLQFENGLKLPGMTITPTEIDLSGSILFNNNLFPTFQFRFLISLLQSSMNSHFIGNPGYTEIGYKSSLNTQCNPTAIGANGTPFPGVYIAPGTSGSSYNLCLCLTNWVRRNSTDTTSSPLQLSLQGNGPYNTAGEYCIPLSTL